jgi:spermidine synthase
MLATMILFAPPSILLGMVSPYAVKLKIKELAKSGSTVGNLYAISTIGSIAGTFVSGFILISYLGNTKILLLLSITLAIASLILHSKGSPKIKIYIILFFIFGFFGIGYLDKICSSKELIFSVDTQYQGIRIYESVDGKTKRPIRYLVTSFSPFLMLSRIWQSAMFVDGDDLYVAYTKFYDLARHFKPDFKHSLMIGGGGYSYPKHYLKKFSDARIDVVEIDPKITDVAMKYFNLEKDPRLTVYHEDGRTFLNKTKNKYDVICIDVFWWFAPPFHLATKEAAQRMRDLLADDGVVLINIVSAAQGKKGKFLRAEYATFKEVFAQVYLFPVQNSKNSLVMQNIMLVALKSEKRPLFKNNDKELNEYLMHIWDKELESDVPVLTDDYAPVENYVLAELG